MISEANLRSTEGNRFNNIYVHRVLVNETIDINGNKFRQ